MISYKHRHEEALRAFTEYLEQVREQRLLKVRVIYIEDSSMGTAQALLCAREYLKSDFFVVSSDLVSGAALTRMADMHRMHGTALVALLRSGGDAADVTDIWAIDAASQRLVAREARSDTSDSTIQLHKAWLRACPSTQLRADLFDCHCYLFSHWVLGVLQANSTLEFIHVRGRAGGGAACCAA